MHIQPELLTRLTTKIFQAAGVPEAPARLVANSLVGANLAGHDSHGVVRIMQYLDGIQAGEYLPDAEPAIAHEKGAMAMVDARRGFGQVAAHYAMTIAIDKARRFGVGAVGLMHCNHVGRLGEWMEMAAAEKMIGLAYCNGAGPGGVRRVSPFGGTQPILGTNPLAPAVPIEGHPPVVIDFATSVVAEGKVRVARNQEKPLPEGCILDSDGNPSTNPQDLYDGGSLLPMAGHKGSGLSILLELIAGVLTGRAAPGSGQVVAGNGVLFVVLEVDAFRPVDGFLADAAGFYDHVKSVPPAPGFEAVLMPGEPERQTAQRRQSEGIVVDDTTWGLIVERAEGLGVAVPGALP
jgi:LDH2 family malate/lactate/ureidoglycolate dehydrogenase